MIATPGAAAIVRRFADLVSIPNVAADPEGLAEVAAWIHREMTARGVKTHVTTTDGAPSVVHGVIEGHSDSMRIGIYAHYDGQPVDPAEWSSPPFEATLMSRALHDGGETLGLPADGDPVDPEWRLYARGTADDRAPIAALISALDNVPAEDREVSIVFLFEGEEEVGSPHLPDYLASLRDELAADVWLICDGPVHQTGRPQVGFGVRGFSEIEIEVFGPPRDLHSGHYGEWAVNPAVALAELLTSMRDHDGRITVDGFAATADPVDEATLAAAKAVPEPGDLGYRPPDDGGHAERLLQPLLNVRGLRSGDVGEASRNVVPASATASIDLRLVAGQEPEEVIEVVRAHVADRGFHLVEGEPSDEVRSEHRLIARVTGRPGYRGVRVSTDEPAAVMVAGAVRAATDEEPVLLPSFGGSVPLHHFQSQLGSPVVILPIANHDNNQHGPNENLKLANLFYGVDVYSALMRGSGSE